MKLTIGLIDYDAKDRLNCAIHKTDIDETVNSTYGKLINKLKYYIVPFDSSDVAIDYRFEPIAVSENEVQIDTDDNIHHIRVYVDKVDENLCMYFSNDEIFKTVDIKDMEGMVALITKTSDGTWE